MASNDLKSEIMEDEELEIESQEENDYQCVTEVTVKEEQPEGEVLVLLEEEDEPFQIKDTENQVLERRFAKRQKLEEVTVFSSASRSRPEWGSTQRPKVPPVRPSTTPPNRRRVSWAQLQILWNFLNSNKDIVTSNNRTLEAKQYSKLKWFGVAEVLNSQNGGCVKNWKRWSKYWVDLKAKIKGRLAAVKSNAQNGGHPSDMTLSEVETKFLQLLGEDIFNGVPGCVVPYLQKELSAGISHDADYPRIENMSESQASPSTITPDPLGDPSTPGLGTPAEFPRRRRRKRLPSYLLEDPIQTEDPPARPKSPSPSSDPQTITPGGPVLPSSGSSKSPTLEVDPLNVTPGKLTDIHSPGSSNSPPPTLDTAESPGIPTDVLSIEISTSPPLMLDPPTESPVRPADSSPTPGRPGDGFPTPGRPGGALPTPGRPANTFLRSPRSSASPARRPAEIPKRRRRREPLYMSEEMARRELVRSSHMRAQATVRMSNSLERLVEEIAGLHGTAKRIERVLRREDSA